tara:strand:- start:24 stop:317 length:294 start_codon:yes stop_codon:yes gene_type:complete
MTDYYDKYIQDLTEQEQDNFHLNEEDLTSCDKCGLIQEWDSQQRLIYCKGDDLEENINCGDYDVLCEGCYYENSKTLKTKILIAYYTIIDYLEGVRQ